MPKPFRPQQRDENRLRANGFIRSPQVTVIDDTGENIGVMNTLDAIRMAQNKGLDLVEVGPTAKPPLCKILDFGKFMYQKEKKDKAGKAIKQVSQEIKIIQLGFKTSPHDMEIRLEQIDKFLEKGYRVKIDLRLRGREKGMGEVARQKMIEFLSYIQFPHAIEMPLKQSPNGLSITMKPDQKQVKTQSNS